MKRSILLCIIVLFNLNVYAQHEKFTPIEINDLQKYFTVHTQEEGPGIDIFGSLLLRLHISNRIEPLKIADYDKPFLESVLKKTQSRFSVFDHNYKYYFEFPSNAKWKKDKAVLSIFINDGLMADYNKEINQNDEFWIFFIINEYNTYKMEGYGRVVDFLNKDGMKSVGLFSPY